MNKLAYGSTHRWLSNLKKTGDFTRINARTTDDFTRIFGHYATLVERVEPLPGKRTGLFESLTK